MRLSIVIPSHSRPDLLALCLGSVRRHAPPGAEILVVDDDSPGGCAGAVAGAFGAGVLRLPRRGGFCVAANAGVARCSGGVVEVLNDDTEVSPGWADAALARFSDPSTAAVAPLVLVGPPGAHAPERIDSAGDTYWLAGIARKRWRGEALAEKHMKPGEVFGASGSGAFYRRSALLAAGGFPEEFVAYFDDIDLSFRLRRGGWRIGYEPASRIHHRVSSSYGPPRGDLLALQSRNEELVFWRNLSPWTLAAMLPLHMAVVAAKALRRWREGQLRAFVSGRLRAVGMVMRG